MWQRLALSGRRLGTLAGLVGLCLLLWILTPHFLTVSNLLNVLEQTSINAVIAVGMTFVILSGGIDLSVGSVLALSGVVMATLLQEGWAVLPAMAAGLAIGFAFGALQRHRHRLGTAAAIHRHAGDDEHCPRLRPALHRGPSGVGLRTELSEPRNRAHPRHSGAGGDHRCRLSGCALRSVLDTLRALRVCDGRQRGSDAALGRQRTAAQDPRVWRRPDSRARLPPCCSRRG